MADGSTRFDLADLRERLASGALSVEALVGTCIERTSAREAELSAWAWFEADYAMKQARALDAFRKSGRPLGPLHGMPVGVKDIIDVRGIPTGNGTALDRGRVAREDAAIVRRLKGAGAVIFGKTVTAELAFLSPGPTRNPVNPAHTPGGSSSGSAAAVAAGMVPLAIGTQTGGSVIRPAAYCGIPGFKPSFGRVARGGILSQSPSLDTVGVFASDIAGLALLADVLFGDDPDDSATADPRPPPGLLRTALAPTPVAPTFAVIRTPWWDQVHPELKAGFEELVAHLGERAFEVALPAPFDQALAVRERINLVEMAWRYRAYRDRDAAALSAVLRDAIERGEALGATDYLRDLDRGRRYARGLAEILERADAILTPAAPGPAPAGLESTGPSTFNALWTLCGLPAVTLPLLESSDGLPIGVQLVGRIDDDGRLLRTARTLHDELIGGGAENPEFRTA